MAIPSLSWLKSGYQQDKLAVGTRHEYFKSFILFTNEILDRDFDVLECVIRRH